MNFKFVSSFIAAAPHQRFANRAHSQHQLHFCSDIRKAHLNSFLFELMGKPMDCCIPSCLELWKQRDDFERSRAVSKDAPLPAAVRRKGDPPAASKDALLQAAVRW
jgi:hypothetical protein